MNTKKSNIALYWVLFVIASSAAIFVYLMLGDAPKTLPKIKLSYFATEKDVAEAVTKRLYQELNQNKFFWIGVEPGKPEYIELARALKIELEKKYLFTRVIVDQELSLSAVDLARLGSTDVVGLKENINLVGEKLSELEKTEKPYLLISASLYTNSLVPKNPLHLIKEKFSVNPITFSFGYFSTTLADEKNMVFACSTEDESGFSKWGCIVANKSRVNRRKVELNNTNPWIGVMDLSGERDYILVLKKK